MLSIPPTIRKELAPTFRNKELQNLFSLPPSKAMEKHGQLVRNLINRGVRRGTALAYLTVLPLLVENEAISRYVEAQEDPELRSCLPEVTTPEEAAKLGMQEMTLPEDQEDVLRRMLARAEALPNE